MEKASDIKQILKDSGLKITKNRLAVLVYLKEKHRPVTVEVLSKKLKINIVTVYRILESFVNKNIVYQTDFREGKNYFEFQNKDHHHHHITCSKCGKRESVDFCIKQKDYKKIIQNTSFAKIDSHILEFFSICKECKN